MAGTTWAISTLQLNRPEDAIRNYQAAIKIDDLFYPAKVNLAMLYNQTGDNDKAETLLREVVTDHPELYEISYSLGLLLAEKEQYDEAVVYLEKAAKGMPGHARVHYNLGLLLAYLQKDKKAELSLLKALEIDPDNRDYLFAAADFYLKRRKVPRSQTFCRSTGIKVPGLGYGLQDS